MNMNSYEQLARELENALGIVHVKSLDEIDRALSELKQRWNEAIETYSLAPAQMEVINLLKYLNTLINTKPKDNVFPVKGIIVLENKKYVLNCSSQNEVDNLVSFAIKKRSEYQELSDLFGYMKECIEKHIELEILPNKDLEGERIALAQGIMIVPNEWAGYSIFSFSSPKCDCGKRQVKTKQLTVRGLKTLEEALAKYANNQILGSIVVAKKTEKYPINETALPIIQEKYEKILGL